MIVYFTSTMTNAICGSFNYNAVNHNDASTIESAVFTFSDITTSLQLSISTSDISKVGSYSIRVSGY